MNTNTSRRITRLVAGPVAAAGIIAGALGCAALANADTPLPTPHKIPVSSSPDPSGVLLPAGSGDLQGMMTQMQLMNQMEAQMQQEAAALQAQQAATGQVNATQKAGTDAVKHQAR